MRFAKSTTLLVLITACGEDPRRDSAEDAGASDAGETFTCFQRDSSARESEPLAPEKICDGVMECRKGEDEADCPDHFVCADEFGDMSPKVVTNDKRCDDFVDCGGTAEDEKNCGRDFQLLCAGYDYFNLALEHQICDGKITCYYGDDEAGCPDTHFCHAFETPSPTAVIKLAQLCDGKWDCEDDEFNCPEIETFKCEKYQGRIPLANKCDGKAHCVDGSDESAANCPGQIDCLDASSQHVCWTCKNEFVRVDQRCNGVADCANGSDERGCVR